MLLLEDWADTALAAGARMALVQAAASDAVLRDGLLPEATPSPLRSLVGALPGGVLSGVGQVLDQQVLQQLRSSLEQLTALVQAQPYFGRGFTQPGGLGGDGPAVPDQVPQLRRESFGGSWRGGLG